MRYPRRYNVVAPVALAVLATGGAGIVAGGWIAAGAGYSLMAAAISAATLAAIVGVAGHAHPHARFGPANSVTTMRVVLTALVGALIGRAAVPEAAWLAIALATAGAVLDGVDGAIARRTGTVSEFGARFDMETDALLILALSILVWQHEKAGAWVLGAGLMRYAFVAAGWLLPWLARPLRSTRRGKAVAVAQIAGLCTALAPIVPAPQSALVAGITVAALAWSFTVDIVWLWRLEP